MPIDPRISLEAQNPQIDLGAVLGQAFQLKQMQQEVGSQNTLRQMLGDSKNLGPDGLPTTNMLAAYTSRYPKQGLALADQIGQIRDRQTEAAFRESEAQQARQKRGLATLEGALDVYRAERAEGITDPQQSLNTLRTTIKDYLDSEGIPEELKAAQWKQISQLSPAGLEALAVKMGMTQEDRQAQTKDWKLVYSPSTGQSYRYNPDTGETTTVSGQKVENPPPDLSASGSTFEPFQGPTGQNWTFNKKTGQWEKASGGPQGPVTKAGGAPQGVNLTPEAIDQAADQIVAGDRSALTNMGRGQQGAADIAAIRNRIAEKYPNLSGAQLAAIDAAFKGQQAGEVYLGRRGAQLSQSGAALDSLIGQSKAAYAKLPRGQFVPFNELLRKVRQGLSSPEEAAAFTADEAVINTWGKAINPTGQLTVQTVDRGEKMLSQATSQAAHDAVLNQMRQEISAEKASVPTARSDVREPGAVPAGAGYHSAQDVKDAFHSGKITKEEAVRRLREDFGYR